MFTLTSHVVVSHSQIRKPSSETDSSETNGRATLTVKIIVRFDCTFRSTRLVSPGHRAYSDNVPPVLATMVTFKKFPFVMSSGILNQKFRVRDRRSHSFSGARLLATVFVLKNNFASFTIPENFSSRTPRVKCTKQHHAAPLSLSSNKSTSNHSATSPSKQKLDF